jgi:hypothetical protein
MPRLLTSTTPTINMDALQALPQYTLPPTYRLGTPGMGCSGDPPGYPTYYLQPIYNHAGNTPHRAPDAVMTLHDTIYIVSPAWAKGETRAWRDARYERRMHRLYVPLPFDHPRTQGWVGDVFRHHRHHYWHPTEVGDHGYPRRSYFWTGTEPSGGASLQQFKDDPRFNDEWRAVERRRIELENQALIEAHRAVAIPQNHVGVIRVREFYPDIEPAWFVPLIEEPPSRVGLWWETEDIQPTPATCPGQYDRSHPVNTTWCQFCGWNA